MPTANGSGSRDDHMSRRAVLGRGLGLLGVSALSALQVGAPAVSGLDKPPTVALAWDAAVLEAIRRTRLGPR